MKLRSGTIKKSATIDTSTDMKLRSGTIKNSATAKSSTKKKTRRMTIAKSARNKELFVRTGPFPFLQLPPELRNIVYSYLFPTRTIAKNEQLHVIPSHKVQHFRPLWFSADNSYDTNFVVRLTCKQMHAEAELIAAHEWSKCVVNIRRLDHHQTGGRPDILSFMTKLDTFPLKHIRSLIMEHSEIGDLMNERGSDSAIRAATEVHFEKITLCFYDRRDYAQTKFMAARYWLEMKDCFVNAKMLSLRYNSRQLYNPHKLLDDLKDVVQLHEPGNTYQYSLDFTSPNNPSNLRSRLVYPDLVMQRSF